MVLSSTSENDNANNGEQASVNGVEPMLVDSDRTSNTDVTNVSTNTERDANGADRSREGQQRQQGQGQGQGQDVEEDPSQRWRALEKLVSRPSPFGNETGQLAVGEFEPFENVRAIKPEAITKEECESGEATTKEAEMRRAWDGDSLDGRVPLVYSLKRRSRRRLNRCVCVFS